MRRLTAVLLTVAAAAGILLLPTAGASAAPAPTVSPSTVPRDGSLTVSGTGCWDPEYDPYAGVGRSAWWVMVQTTPLNSSWTHALGTAYTDEWHDGAWSVTLRLPDTMGPGAYAVYARCILGPEEFDFPAVPFTVVGDPIPPKWWEVPQPPGGYTPGVTPTPPAGRAPGTPTAAPGSTPPVTQPPAATTQPSTPTATPTTTFSATPACSDCAKLVEREERVQAGDELSLSYAGFQPGEQVTVVMRSTPVTLGTFTADASGVVTAAVTIPASAEAGAHTLTLSGPVTGDHVVPFRLAAAPQEKATAAAPSSGGTELALPLASGAAGLLLLAVGGVALRRRRTARPGASAAPADTGRGQETATPISEPIA